MCYTTIPHHYQHTTSCYTERMVTVHQVTAATASHDDTVMAVTAVQILHNRHSKKTVHAVSQALLRWMMTFAA